MATKIQWAEDVWNPLVGCQKISTGCDNCYAIRMAHRLSGMAHSAAKYAGTTKKMANGEINWTGKVLFHPASMDKPLNNKKPTIYFVNSMSDLFHKDVTFEVIDEIYNTMDAAYWHTFQVLTKRSEIMAEYYRWKEEGNGYRFEKWPLENVWIGVSVEDQRAAYDRIPYLIRIPAAVRFLSCEPLLSKIDLDVQISETSRFSWLDLIGWVIVGGESGNKSRKMELSWVEDIRDQCKFHVVPFFFKQWGGRNKKKSGRELDGRTYDEMPIVDKQ